METKITKQYNQGDYEQIIKFLEESKTIYFIDCTCGDFIHRQIKKTGKFSNITYSANPCKHLSPIIKVFEAAGWKLKSPKEMIGTDKCTSELRRFLVERSGGLCECGCGRPGQEVHRKTPKALGGKYNKENCLLLYNDCHKIRTYQT